MKKLKILVIAGFSILCGIYGFFLGTTQVPIETKAYEVREVIPEGYIKFEDIIDEIHDNYVDMRRVVDFEVSEDSLQLYLSDGSGYYLER